MSLDPRIWAALAAVVLVGGAIFYIYGKGERAGSADVVAKVNAETVRTLDAARRNKERIEDAVRDAPLDSVIDGLR